LSVETVTFGPFRGYQSSVEAVRAPQDFIVGATNGLSGSRDVLLDTTSGMWFRRNGCAIRGDTISSGLEVSGLLESGMKFNARARKLFPLNSPSLLSGKSTYAVLYGSDANSTSFPTVDTGFFGTLYARASATATDPQTPSGGNYNLLKEFGIAHYPTDTSSFVVSTQGLIVCPPLWYESGEGGYMRGAFRFARQQIAAGSRSCVVADDRVIFPCLRATPFWWDGALNDSTGTSNANTVNYFPLGPFAPLPTVTIADGAVATGNDGVWTDGDTFYYSVIYRNRDGSYSQPTLPRAKNANLASGLYLRVVGTIGNTAKYRSQVWSSVPVGPPGTVARLILRTPKQARSAATDAITISPLDLRVVGILTNNTQTSFTDTNGSDVGLIENDDVVRFDTVCPRRARYMWTGDQRAQIGYTLPSPHAIILAVTGRAASGDTSDEAADSQIVQGSTGYVYRITSTALELYEFTASTTLGAVVSIDWATYPTIQDVVDKINATTIGGTAKEWRAQIAPGADPSAASSFLCPTVQTVNACTAAGVTLTTPNSFANIPVGAYVSYTPGGGGSAVTTGTYVKSKESNTSLTLSQSATTGGAVTVSFYAYCGDGSGAPAYWSGSTLGLIRVFCPAYPGFIYFKRSALPGYDRPDKQKVFFTVGSPGAASAGSSLAINAWGGDNFRLPTIANPGALLGGVDIEGASIVAYQNGIALFQNVKGNNTGEDFDYKLFTINGSRGPVSWSALVSGNGWAAYTTREGVFCTDKNKREFSIGGAIYNPARGLGDLAYEINNSIVSTDKDLDNSGLFMSVMRGRIAVSYGDSAGGTPILFYDFTPGIEASGVEELLDPEGRRPYGWSAPCKFNATNSIGLTVIGTVPSSSGIAYYACHTGNNSATADGRVDEIETGNTDNAEAQFHGYAYMPHFLAESFSRISPQRLDVLHKKPNGTNLTFIKVSRDQTFSSSNNYLLSASGSNQFKSEVIQLKSNPDRGPIDMVWLLWDDSEATQGNGIWQVALQYQKLPL
jgi:hypothetical protein